MKAPTAAPKGMSLEAFSKPAEAPVTAAGAAKAAATGAIKGVGNTLSIHEILPQLLERPWEYLSSMALEKLGIMTPEQAKGARDAQIPQRPGVLETVGETIGAPFHKAGNDLERGLERGGEFLSSAAVAGPAAARDLPGSVVKYGAGPWLGSEAAGAVTKGTAAEPYARVVGALVGGAPGLVHDLTKPSNILSREVSNLTPAQMDAAEALMKDAQAMGSPLTAAEAIQQVTGGATRLGDIQRVVEQSQRGGEALKPMMAERAARNEAAVGQAIEGIGPQSANPMAIPGRVQKAAEGALDDVRQGINAKAKPYYDASRTQMIPDAESAAIQSNPAFQVALSDIRGNPILNGSIKDLPDNSIAVIDAVKKRMDAMKAAAAKEGDNFLEGEIASGRKTMLEQADAVSSDYATARAIGAEGRQTRLAPLEESPVGSLSRTGEGGRVANAEDAFTQQARILFPNAPKVLDPLTIRSTVTRLNKQDPTAARDLTTQFLKSQFDEIGQKLQSGQNQWAGAKYSAVIAGNKQQAQNLEAAIKALPNGDQAWSGFKRMLDVFEAQGKRQPAGSPTEFNRQLNVELGGGGLGEAAANAVSPGKWTTWAKDMYQNFRYGRNTDVFAKVLTNPDAISELRKLAVLKPDSPKAQNIVMRILEGAARPLRNPLAVSTAVAASPEPVAQ